MSVPALPKYSEDIKWREVRPRERHSDCPEKSLMDRTIPLSRFNRNGMSCRNLYQQMRGHKGPSQTRKNIDALRKGLANVGINDVIETNVICYSTPMSNALTHAQHQGGKAAGSKIFWEILGIIRPIILIAHGAGTTEELRRVLSLPATLPPAASNQAQGVSCVRVCTRLRGHSYSPIVFVIPSLAPPKWNNWQRWAPAHFAKTCAQARKFL
jgi:hypothetical protein